MKNRLSISIMFILCILSFENIHAQVTCIKLKNGMQHTYPTNCIRKLYFSGNQLILDLINPTPILVTIDSIQTIWFNQTPPMQTNVTEIEGLQDEIMDSPSEQLFAFKDRKDEEYKNKELGSIENKKSEEK